MLPISSRPDMNSRQARARSHKSRIRCQHCFKPGRRDYADESRRCSKAATGPVLGIKKAPDNAGALRWWREGKNQYLATTGLFPVEFVVHAEQHGLYPLPGQNGFAGRDRARNPGEVLGEIIFEEDVVPFREHRPIRRKHPFETKADVHSRHGKATRGLKQSAAWQEHRVAVGHPRHAALDITEQRRRPQVADPACRRVDRLETVGFRTRDVRSDMASVYVAEIETAADAKHQIAGLEVTTDLTAADKAAIFLTAVIRENGANPILPYQRRIHLAPGATDIAADEAAGPRVHDRCDDRASLDRHVRSRGNARCSQAEQNTRGHSQFQMSVHTFPLRGPAANRVMKELRSEE